MTSNSSRHTAASRVLVVKLADFGDALLTTPALRSLRDGHPDASLDVLTTPQAAPVFMHCGLVDEVIAFEKEAFDGALGGLASLGAALRLARRLRGNRYDAVVFFHHLTMRYGALKHASLALATGAQRRYGLARDGAWRGAFLNHPVPDPGFGAVHEVELMLSVARAAGGREVDARLCFLPGGEAEDRAERLLAPTATEGRQRVALHPGSGGFSRARRWPAERFAAVADALVAGGAEVVVVGRADDGGDGVLASCRQSVLDLTDRTDLPTLASVLSRMDAFVGGDSGVMHLATAMETPVVAVFGPSNDAAWGPWWSPPAGDNGSASSPHRVFSLALPCRPCLYREYSLGARDGCATRDCLGWLEPGPVTAAVARALRQGRRRKY